MPKAKRKTVADWRAINAAVQMDRDRYMLALHDVVNGTEHIRARVGTPVSVKVDAYETKDGMGVSATVYRPKGACPYVMLHFHTRGAGLVPNHGYVDAYTGHVEVTDLDSFIAHSYANDEYLALLRDRLRRALAEYHAYTQPKATEQTTVSVLSCGCRFYFEHGTTERRLAQCVEHSQPKGTE